MGKFRQESFPKDGNFTHQHHQTLPSSWRVLFRVPGWNPGEGVFLGNPLRIPREDLGTLGKIRGITTPLEES